VRAGGQLRHARHHSRPCLRQRIIPPRLGPDPLDPAADECKADQSSALAASATGQNLGSAVLLGPEPGTPLGHSRAKAWAVHDGYEQAGFPKLLFYEFSRLQSFREKAPLRALRALPIVRGYGWETQTPRTVPADTGAAPSSRPTLAHLEIGAAVGSAPPLEPIPIRRDPNPPRQSGGVRVSS
jgi:hypothetical protein